MGIFHNQFDFLVSIGIGDALTIPIEFVKPDDPAYDNLKKIILSLSGYGIHPKYDIGGGSYTDDTEMSVAVAKVLLENDFPYTKLQFANAFVAEFKRGGERPGYAGGFYKFLKTLNSGSEMIERIRNESTSNGAAMRAIPIGALPDIEQVLETAKLQAEITHNSPEGIFSAQVVALMAYCAFHSSIPLCMIANYVGHYLSNTPFSSIFSKPYDGKRVKADSEMSLAVRTVWACLDLVGNSGNYKEMIIKIFSWGGDTDTLGAISFGIFGIGGKLREIPTVLYTELEKGSKETGCNYLLDIGSRLIEKYY